MEHTAHGQITAHAGHVFDVTAEKAVFTDGGAVGLGLVKAKENADGVGLFSGFQIADSVDHQRTFGVLLEEGPFVKPFSGPLVFESRLLDIRRGRVLRIGEGFIPIPDGAVSYALASSETTFAPPVA